MVAPSDTPLVGHFVLNVNGMLRTEIRLERSKVL